MDSDHGAVFRNAAFFETPKTTLPPLSPCQPSEELAAEDAFYDSVPQEENISYIDGKLMICLHKNHMCIKTSTNLLL